VIEAKAKILTLSKTPHGRAEFACLVTARKLATPLARTTCILRLRFDPDPVK
jgi:hypothetical protein